MYFRPTTTNQGMMGECMFSDCMMTGRDGTKDHLSTNILPVSHVIDALLWKQY